MGGLEGVGLGASGQRPVLDAVAAATQQMESLQAPGAEVAAAGQAMDDGGRDGRTLRHAQRLLDGAAMRAMSVRSRLRSQGMKGMTIAGLAREGGVGVATVRHYQRLGLLPVQPRPPVGGTGGRIRRYGQEDLRRLRFVREAWRAGFSLEAVGRLLTIGSPGSWAQARAVASARVAWLDARISELSAARDALVRLAAACAETAGGYVFCGADANLRSSVEEWRKGWDSNPRYSCPYAGFRDRSIQPLWHPSEI